MKPLITPKFSLANSFIPKKIFATFLVLWILIAIPLSAAVYSYLAADLRKNAEIQQVDQERLLKDFFEKSSRYGDIVNSKTQIESLGKGFGLEQVWICRNGVDVIGGMTTQTCPTTARTYSLEMLGQPLDMRFIWSTDPTAERPLLLRSILLTFVSSLTLFALIGWLTYRYLTRKISRLSHQIAEADGHGLKLDYELPELKPIVTSLSLLYAKIEQNNEDIANLRTAAALGKLSRQVAHDIRSPLSALRIVSAKLGLRTDISDLVTSAISRIDGIAQDLLNFDESKHSRPSCSVDKDYFEKIVLLKSAERQCNVTTAIALTGPVHLFFSEVSLSRALSNLLNNSIEAEAVKIEVKVAIQNNRLQIIIEDNGKGIPAKLIPHLGAGQVSSLKEGGHGLGLSYLFREIRRAEGDVEVSSEVGVGTRILFWLPIHPIAEVQTL